MCCDSVYDFVLFLFVLYILFFKNVEVLVYWFLILLCNCFIVLDIYDGIGIVDVGVNGDKLGLFIVDVINLFVD